MSETKSTQLKNNKNGEDSDGDDDIDEHEQPLNKSLTSMDWLQKLNAEYVGTQFKSNPTSKSVADLTESEPDSSTSNTQCDNCSKFVSEIYYK